MSRNRWNTPWQPGGEQGRLSPSLAYATVMLITTGLAILNGFVFGWRAAVVIVILCAVSYWAGTKFR